MSLLGTLSVVLDDWLPSVKNLQIITDWFTMWRRAKSWLFGPVIDVRQLCVQVNFMRRKLGYINSNTPGTYWPLNLRMMKTLNGREVLCQSELTCWLADLNVDSYRLEEPCSVHTAHLFTSAAFGLTILKRRTRTFYRIRIQKIYHVIKTKITKSE